MRARTSRRTRILVAIGVLLAIGLTRAVWKNRGSSSRPKTPVVLPVWTPAGTPPALPARSPGCERTGAASGEMVRTVRVRGNERTYRLFVPPPTAGDRALPVVFSFHGGKQPTGKTVLPLGGVAGVLPELAQVGAIYVSPQGTLFPRERTLGWYAGCPSDDVEFFDAMLSEIGASHCIDPRAVLVTGFSWGADMALALACCRGERIRAVAPASGANLHAMPRCPAARLPALRATYAANEPFYDVAELAASVAFFRQVHRCQEGSDQVEPAPCVAHRGCAQAVVECRYSSIGHQVPPGFSRDTWAFFTKLIADDPLGKL